MSWGRIPWETVYQNANSCKPHGASITSGATKPIVPPYTVGKEGTDLASPTASCDQSLDHCTDAAHGHPGVLFYMLASVTFRLLQVPKKGSAQYTSDSWSGTESLICQYGRGCFCVLYSLRSLIQIIIQNHVVPVIPWKYSVGWQGSRTSPNRPRLSLPRSALGWFRHHYHQRWAQGLWGRPGFATLPSAAL